MEGEAELFCDDILASLQHEKGLHDSVCTANLKRAAKCEKLSQDSFTYATTNYDDEFSQVESIPNRLQSVLQERSTFQRSFMAAEGETQLSVSVRLEPSLRSKLVRARGDILDTLCDAGAAEREDITSPVWIPSCAIIPEEDLHITLCLPRKWRTAMSPENKQRMAMVMDEVSMRHAPFAVELDRVVLLPGGALLALFRLEDCSRPVEDPMVALRLDILKGVLTKELAFFQLAEGASVEATHLAHDEGDPCALVRRCSVASSIDPTGFIHCSLGRLAIKPGQTLQKVRLHEAVSLCARMSAELSGSRMIINRFLLTEMTGLSKYGVFNPFKHAVGHDPWEREFKLQGEANKQEEA